MLQKESSSDSNTVNESTVNNGIPAKKRKVSRSNKAILGYTDKLRENYEDSQSKIMNENWCFIESLMEFEKRK